MKQHTKLVTRGLGLLFLVGAMGWAASSARPAGRETSGSERVKRVRVATVEPASGTQPLRFSGVTRAQDRAVLSFPVGARLAERPVRIGERVRKGQVIAAIDARELANAVDAATASVAEMEARLAQLERDVGRVEQLVELKAATTEEMERVVAARASLAASLEAARARLRESERLRSEGTLSAPYDGTVTQVMAEPGEWVSPGKPVVEISASGGVEVEVGVPESLVLAIAEGDAVRIELPMARGLKLDGAVRTVGLAAGGAGRLFPVVVDLGRGGDGLVPGMTAEVLFELGGDGELTVPLAAILNPGGERPQVFRLDGDRAHRVEVEVERLIGDRVAVSGALALGDRVVVTGHTALIDGDLVEVAGMEVTQ